MIEVNGPSNIITEINTAQAQGRPVRLDFIEKQALMTVGYMREHDLKPALKWHEFIAQWKLNNEMEEV